MLHLTRHLFVRQQNAVINSIWAHLAELGVVAPVGRNGVEELPDVVADPDDDRVPEVARETAQAIDQSGWLHTGDVATVRDDGAIRFLGRYKDLLKVGGENVDPAEVESFLSTHPDIAQVQVVGVPDPRLSEVVCACIVPKSNCSVTTADLDTFCRGKLASFKIPRHTQLPSTSFR